MASITHSTNPPRRAKTGGRRAGTPNRFTREFRQTVADLLDANTDNVATWLASVALGNPAIGRAPDPARALELLVKLAEFAAPKLGRIEHTATNGAPMPTTIEIEFVDAPATALVPGLQH